MGFSTKLIHGKLKDYSGTGATNVPIFYSNGYAHKTAKELEDVFAGRDIKYVYSRISNPSVEAFEKRMIAIEGGVSAVATASGMSAIYLTLMNILEPGDEIISSSGVFGGTYNLLKNLEDYNIKVNFSEKLSAEVINQIANENTKVVFAETIGNPMLEVLNIEEIAKVCNERQIIFVVDSTVTTPAIIKPLDYGVDIVIHSTSKYINGTANSIGGLIVDGGSVKFKNPKFKKIHTGYKKFNRFAFTATLRNGIAKDIGAVLSPMNSFLNLIGIETLELRMRMHCQNALELADYLQKHPKVKLVNYPGLNTSCYYPLVQKYYNNLAGGIITIRLGSKVNAFKFIDGLKLINNTANIGDTKSLVIHPASTICINNTVLEKEQMGVYDDLVRLSVGIENIEDIIEDVETALKGV